MNNAYDLLDLPAGSGQANDPADIAALDDALRNIDAYAPPPEYEGAPQRYATEPMIRALERFSGTKRAGHQQRCARTLHRRCRGCRARGRRTRQCCCPRP